MCAHGCQRAGDGERADLAHVDDLAALDLPQRHPPELADRVELLALAVDLHAAAVAGRARVGPRRRVAVVLCEEGRVRAGAERGPLGGRERAALLARVVLAVLLVELRRQNGGSGRLEGWSVQARRYRAAVARASPARVSPLARAGERRRASEGAAAETKARTARTSRMSTSGLPLNSRSVSRRVSPSCRGGRGGTSTGGGQRAGPATHALRSSVVG